MGKKRMNNEIILKIMRFLAIGTGFVAMIITLMFGMIINWYSNKFN